MRHTGARREDHDLDEQERFDQVADGLNEKQRLTTMAVLPDLARPMAPRWK